MNLPTGTYITPTILEDELAFITMIFHGQVEEKLQYSINVSKVGHEIEAHIHQETLLKLVQDVWGDEPEVILDTNSFAFLVRFRPRQPLDTSQKVVVLAQILTRTRFAPSQNVVTGSFR
jgi:hypothetical protein